MKSNKRLRKNQIKVSLIKSIDNQDSLNRETLRAWTREAKFVKTLDSEGLLYISSRATKKRSLGKIRYSTIELVLDSIPVAKRSDNLL